MIPYADFTRNADAIHTRIAAACAAAGRSPATVELLAVTKTHPPEALACAAHYGFKSIGENRVQEAVEKKSAYSALPHFRPLRWELIGHLQSNKSALAVATFDRIQSVDSIKLLSHLDHAAAEAHKILPILLQINAGADPAKFGASLADAPALLEAALRCPHLHIDGLMTIAPLSDDPSVARRTFATLRELRDSLAKDFGTPLPVLSMGMSGDLEAAIAEGSTLIRIGSALFGERG